MLLFLGGVSGEGLSSLQTASTAYQYVLCLRNESHHLLFLPSEGQCCSEVWMSFEDALRLLVSYESAQFSETLILSHQGLLRSEGKQTTKTCKHKITDP